MNTHDALIEFFLFFVPALVLWLINTALSVDAESRESHAAQKPH
jgi:hypothetical protein